MADPILAETGTSIVPSIPPRESSRNGGSSVTTLRTADVQAEQRARQQIPEQGSSSVATHAPSSATTPILAGGSVASLPGITNTEISPSPTPAPTSMLGRAFNWVMEGTGLKAIYEGRILEGLQTAGILAMNILGVWEFAQAGYSVVQAIGHLTPPPNWELVSACVINAGKMAALGAVTFAAARLIPGGAKLVMNALRSETIQAASSAIVRLAEEAAENAVSGSLKEGSEALTKVVTSIAGDCKEALVKAAEGCATDITGTAAKIAEKARGLAAGEFDALTAKFTEEHVFKLLTDCTMDKKELVGYLLKKTSNLTVEEATTTVAGREALKQAEKMATGLRHFADPTTLGRLTDEEAKKLITEKFIAAYRKEYIDGNAMRKAKEELAGMLENATTEARNQVASKQAVNEAQLTQMHDELLEATSREISNGVDDGIRSGVPKGVERAFERFREGDENEDQDRQASSTTKKEDKKRKIEIAEDPLKAINPTKYLTGEIAEKQTTQTPEETVRSQRAGWLARQNQEEALRAAEQSAAQFRDSRTTASTAGSQETMQQVGEATGKAEKVKEKARSANA